MITLLRCESPKLDGLAQFWANSQPSLWILSLQDLFSPLLLALWLHGYQSPLSSTLKVPFLSSSCLTLPTEANSSVFVRCIPQLTRLLYLHCIPSPRLFNPVTILNIFTSIMLLLFFQLESALWFFSAPACCGFHSKCGEDHLEAYLR